MYELQDIDYALARVLYDSVTSDTNKSFNLDYSECAERMSEILGRKVAAHGGLRMPLYRVASLCYELGLPLITSIVRFKNAKSAYQVGQGFYTMACEFRPAYKEMEPDAAWKAELSRVKLCKEWDILDLQLKKYEGKLR